MGAAAAGAAREDGRAGAARDVGPLRTASDAGAAHAVGRGAFAVWQGLNVSLELKAGGLDERFTRRVEVAQHGDPRISGGLLAALDFDAHGGFGSPDGFGGLHGLVHDGGLVAGYINDSEAD